MFAWEWTLWQSQTQRGKVIEVDAGSPFMGTFCTHYSKPIKPIWVENRRAWQPYLDDCLLASLQLTSNSNTTSVKTCLAYYRLVHLVGAVWHVPQTVTVNHSPWVLKFTRAPVCGKQKTSLKKIDYDCDGDSTWRKLHWIYSQPISVSQQGWSQALMLPWWKSVCL